MCSLKLLRLFIVLWFAVAASAADVSLVVRDQTGAPLRASGELRSAGQPARPFITATDGTWTGRLDTGDYSIVVSSRGFQTATQQVHVVAATSQVIAVTLHLASASTEVEVSDKLSTLDSAARVARSIPEHDIQEHPGAEVSRQTVDLVAGQPGWILEANGVLHPRGSEYDTQFIVDGLPLLENRSPGFAPPIDTDDVQSMTVWTAGYPAEFGRKLGGVVEVTTKHEFVPGWHGSAEFDTGSFDTQAANFQVGDVLHASSFTIAANAARTARFLDPPAIENFTNTGNLAGLRASLSHQFTGGSRLRFGVITGASEFDVPNELAQQVAGQLQKRRTGETAGQVALQKVLSPSLLLDVNASMRSFAADLWSNAQSTPIQAGQNRALREGYASASITGHHGRHDWQAGADLVVDNLNEAFHYAITDPHQFDPDILPQFAFAGARNGTQSALYAQDRVSFGPVTVSGGLRWDDYRLVVHRNAFSPRLAASWKLPRAGIVLHASYDRAFETPASENLLLANSAAAQTITPIATGLPLVPSRGNFYELGLSKIFGQVLRIDASAFRRTSNGFFDDDVLLNTGISLPISFAAVQVEGIESSIRMSIGTRAMWTLNYSNLSGVARGPITGGLFLEGAAVLADRSSFRISQDQRNTVSSRVRYAFSPRAWVAMSGRYGSGLPVEVDPGETTTTDPRILSRVNLSRGRVRPGMSLDAQAGYTLYQKEQRQAQLQFAVSNLTNRLNVINFAGVFSGTAIDASRAYSLRMRYEF